MFPNRDAVALCKNDYGSFRPEKVVKILGFHAVHLCNDLGLLPAA